MRIAWLVVCLSSCFLLGCVVHRAAPVIGDQLAIVYRVDDGFHDYQVTINIQKAQVELRDSRGIPLVVASTGDERVADVVKQILNFDLHCLREKRPASSGTEVRAFRRTTIRSMGSHGALVVMRDYRVAGQLEDEFYELENLFEELASRLQPVYRPSSETLTLRTHVPKGG
jgi:hypothetical protein